MSVRGLGVLIAAVLAALTLSTGPVDSEENGLVVHKLSGEKMGSLSCHTVGDIELRVVPEDSLAEVRFGEDCEPTVRVRKRTAEDLQLFGAPRLSSKNTSFSGWQYTSASVVAEHAQLPMFWLRTEFAFGHDGTQINWYVNGNESGNPSGCGWFWSYGPIGYWDTYSLPAVIRRAGYAEVDTNCSPTDGGWIRPIAHGDYNGVTWPACTWDVLLPYGSSIRCGT